MKGKQVILSVGMLVFLVLAGLQFFRPAAAKQEMKPAVAPAAHRSRVPRLAAGPLQIETGTNDLTSTNAFARFPWGVDRPKLTAEQVEAYLRENHRDAASLLAAARASGDKTYLREAMEKYPNDPRVAFDAYFLAGPRDSDKLASAESRNWLDAFKQSDPDPASAQAVLEMGIGLGERFNGPGQFPLINTLVGMAIERNILGAMDPNSPFLDTGLTVQNQIDALNQRRASLKPIAAQGDALLPKMSDADLVSFYDRLRMFGEPAAMNWALNKYARQ